MFFHAQPTHTQGIPPPKAALYKHGATMAQAKGAAWTEAQQDTVGGVGGVGGVEDATSRRSHALDGGGAEAAEIDHQQNQQMDDLDARLQQLESWSFREMGLSSPPGIGAAATQRKGSGGGSEGEAPDVDDDSASSRHGGGSRPSSSSTLDLGGPAEEYDRSSLTTPGTPVTPGTPGTPGSDEGRRVAQDGDADADKARRSAKRGWRQDGDVGVEGIPGRSGSTGAESPRGEAMNMTDDDLVRSLPLYCTCVALCLYTCQYACMPACTHSPAFFPS